MPSRVHHFSVTDEPLGPSGIVLTVEGELDVATAPELRESLAAAFAAGARRIVLDLCAVTFIDSVAVAAILQARRQLGDSGRIACATPPGSYIRMILDIAGGARSLELFETRAAAVDGFRA